MKCTIPEISWHNRDPVLSVDIQPSKASDSVYRVATGGTDSHVLIWLLSVEKGGVALLECAADLTRHTKPVNCVRFSPSGDFLATGDDESCIILWKMKTGNDPVECPIGEEENFKEQWVSFKVLRGHLQDVYDLCWSADSKNLVSGSVDNTAILWDVSSGKNLGILAEHKGFVQGVAWDPCGQYVATICSDRICRVYNASSRKVVSRLYKGQLPGVDAESKPIHFFHDDTLKSFFRRLTFTPDGELLIVPSGIVEEAGKNPSHSSIVFSRNYFQKPVVYLPSLSQYTVAVRCCPVLFSLRPMQSEPLFDLPYRIVIAVATQCSVVLYDTQHAAPFAFITKIHYTRLTDLSWSSDGRVLVVSSTDGYCSVITFAENELGAVYTSCKKVAEEKPKQESKTTNSQTEQKINEVTENICSSVVETNSPKTHNENECIEKTKMSLEISKEEEHQKKQSADTNGAVHIFSTQDQNRLDDPKPTQSIINTPMEVDDFQLVYEGTLTDPVSSVKSPNQTEQNKDGLQCHVESTESTNTLSIQSIEPENKTEPSVESPNKSTTTLQKEALTSPKSLTSVTASNSSKKTPRRVQLITLSSPKSKKKLLE